MEQKKLTGCGLRTILWGMVIFGGIVLGFIFLMRSCLSKYDTFGTVGWPGLTEDQKSLVIVKSYSKTNSYSSKNGMTNISYTTTYYLERIDLATGKVEKKTKLMNHRKIKKGALECFGGYKNRLWIFANNLRAYDMNTLEQTVKIEDIEAKNPQLKGKMPVETQYYDAHLNLGYITITALDGDKYRIMLDDLHAELIDPQEDSFEKFAKDFEKQQEILKTRIDSLEQANRNTDYRNYDKVYAQRDVFYKMNDSLRAIEENARNIFQAQRNLFRKLEDFDPWSSSDIDDWIVMQDTANGSAFVLSKEEPDDKTFGLQDYTSMGLESDKVKLYRMDLEVNKESHSMYDDFKVLKTETLGDNRYLQGSFMQNYKTAGALQLKNPGGFIIFSRDIIGNKAKLLVTRVDFNGKQIWQMDAQMSFKLSFAAATDNYLILCGIVNSEKAPSFAVSDALRIIDLKTGSLVAVKY
jgi:ASC-1-like (ASCH) protein